MFVLMLLLAIFNNDFSLAQKFYVYAGRALIFLAQKGYGFLVAQTSFGQKGFALANTALYARLRL